MTSNGGTTSATTPLTYRSAGAVYRSLAAVPASVLEVSQQQRSEKPFTPLVGPQPKQRGEFVWAETKGVHAELKEAQPLPIPLIVAQAPHNTLYIESNPVAKVIAAVHDLFEQHQVDFAYNEAKFKWKCTCYSGQVETRFVSRLFSVPNKANFFVLDFQRRLGDPFQFQSVYKAINFKLVKSGFIVSCSEQKAMPEPQMRSFQPMTLPDDFFTGDEVQEEKCEEDFEALRRMCLSPYIDVQREGLLVLANQLEQDGSARRCMAPFAEKLVEAVQLSRDDQVRRLAASALAAISSDESSHAFIRAKGGLVALANTAMSETDLPETRRQAVRTLLNMREFDSETKRIVKGAVIAKDARWNSLVQRLQAAMN